MIEQEFRTALLADSGVAALTNRMYAQQLKQGAAMPCIVYSFSDGYGPLMSASVSGIKMYTVTLRVYGDTYGSCRDLTKAVLTYIHGLSTTLTTDTVVSARIQNVFGDYEETLELYSSVIDFTMHVQEA